MDGREDDGGVRVRGRELGLKGGFLVSGFWFLVFFDFIVYCFPSEFDASFSLYFCYSRHDPILVSLLCSS